MIKKVLIIIILLLGLHYNLNAKTLTLEWFWGIESFGYENKQYFIMAFKPEIKLNSFALKLDLPLEINSNHNIVDYHWDSKYDIITKLDYLSYTNQMFFAKIKTLNNIVMGNGELVYDYSNDLFNPLLIKKGLNAGFKIKSFQSIIIIDDLNDNDLFFIDLNYAYNKIKAGAVIAYDNDIFDPYTERPVDNNNQISSLNTYFNYQVLKKEKWNLYLQNDLIKNLKTYKFEDNMVFASGGNLQYSKWLNVKAKFKYYQESLPPRILFNKFYEIERNVINNNLSKNNSFGVSSLINCNVKKYISISFFIEKVDKFLPYTGIKLSSLEDFFTKIRFSLQIYNRLNDKFYHIIGEKKSNTFTIFRNYVPLSENLCLNLDYLKGFKYKNDELNELRRTIFYLKFIF